MEGVSCSKQMNVGILALLTHFNLEIRGHSLVPLDALHNKYNSCN